MKGMVLNKNLLSTNLNMLMWRGASWIWATFLFRILAVGLMAWELGSRGGYECILGDGRRPPLQKEGSNHCLLWLQTSVLKSPGPGPSILENQTSNVSAAKLSFKKTKVMLTHSPFKQGIVQIKAATLKPLVQVNGLSVFLRLRFKEWQSLVHGCKMINMF